MLLPFDSLVLAAHAIIDPVLIGPGAFPTVIAAESYTAIATQLHAAAAGTDGSMTQMGETWRGPSSDTAQAGFREHASWLRAQGDVAAATAAQLNAVATTYTTAQEAMVGLSVWLAEFEVRQAVLEAAAAVSTPVAPLALAMDTEIFAIVGAALGVMGAYAATLGPILASFPEPVLAQPIVSNAGGPVLPTAMSVDYLSSGGSGGLGTALYSPTMSGSSSLLQSSSTTGSESQQIPSSTTQSADPTSPQTAAAEQSSPNVDPSVSGSDPGTNGSQDSVVNQQHVSTGSQDSLRSGTVGAGAVNAVALGMTRGRLGSMSGASTGYKMPANWRSGTGARTFGASSAAPAEAPVTRAAAPRGAIAPEGRMRRRRDEDEKKASKVYTPGDPQDVPVLEHTPVVGVIEYSDEGGSDE
ncbi:PPE domain-containing protein [Nocardia miyunensis]|uniref:PPE domain-containing protein n=1 Tax=Nocardia miyunensis TaxID=282684 RepID=UPI00082A20E6|nr:PPE domain-containing protein [Nocardia miyunensis]